MEIDLSIIAAMTPDGVIGGDGKLLWHLPSDLARFKNRTLRDGVMIMGRKTHESILDAREGRVLSRRRHIVLTRKPIPPAHESVVRFVASLEEACADVATHGNCASVIGGGEMFTLFQSMVNTLYITTVYANIRGDTHFPMDVFADKTWKKVSSLFRCQLNPKDEYETAFDVYKRIHV